MRTGNNFLSGLYGMPNVLSASVLYIVLITSISAAAHRNEI